MAKHFEVTQDFLQSKFDLNSIDESKAALFKFFLDKEVDKRPSKEVAAWFVKKLDENRFDNLSRTIIREGYFTYADLFAYGLTNYAKSATSLHDLYLHIEHPFPKTTHELLSLWRDYDEAKRHGFARALLVMDIEVVDYPKETTGKRNDYIAFIENNFEALYTNLARSDEDKIQFMWNTATYVPASFIIEKFRQAVGFSHQLAEVGLGLERLIYRERITIEILVDELIPYLQQLPQSGPAYPFIKDCGTPAIIKGLSLARRDLAKASTAMKVKVYNMFMRPLMANPEILRPVVNPYEWKGTLKSVAAIAGAVVPSADLVMFCEALTSMSSEKLFKRTLVEILANVKTEAMLPVSKEFIDYQLSLGIGYGVVCLNNICINDINFWLYDMKHRRHQETILFPRELSWNVSFMSNFNLKVSDLYFYLENKNKIVWNVFLALNNIPREFLEAFKLELPISYLSEKVLASMDEDLIETYLQTAAAQNWKIPTNIALKNKKLSNAFIVKYGPKLFSNRYSIERCDHLRLTDLVAALT